MAPQTTTLCRPRWTSLGRQVLPICIGLLGLMVVAWTERADSQEGSTHHLPKPLPNKPATGETMETVMLQFKHQGPSPTIDDVQRLFNLTAEEIDAQFGVLPTDPSEGLYAVLIDVRASERIKAVLATRPSDPAEGIFANPPIEPFGPPDQ